MEKGEPVLQKKKSCAVNSCVKHCFSCLLYEHPTLENELLNKIL